MSYIWGMKKIDDNLPISFIAFQANLKETIYSLGLTQKHVYNGIGMSRTTWERRLIERNFTGNEVLKICNWINK